ncbi:MAG: hypothetical protein C5B57_11385 [Blastocatellia bacterium]|nr:MAG: hypothetical protein C5B57_11385 [Blastocatellia bacterium]
MLTRQQRTLSSRVAVVIALCCLSSTTWAQEPEQSPSQRSSFLWDATKHTLFDPTTYAPAALNYDATVRDWTTSQLLFRHGFLEHNPRFTISGLPNDAPVSYSEGNRRILSDAITNFGLSFASNFTSRIVERALMERYPQHRKLVKTLGWVERIGVGAYMSYLLSSEHYRQASINTEVARQMGYR